MKEFYLLPRKKRRKKRVSTRLWLSGIGFLLFPAIAAYIFFAPPPEPLPASPPRVNSLMPPLSINLASLPTHIRVLRTNLPYRAKNCEAKYRNLCIQKIPLESYVEGVVLAEEEIFLSQKPSLWPFRYRRKNVKEATQEAWALQAVAARTYALYVTASRRHGKRPYDIQDSPRDQAYKDKRHPLAEKAVKRTTSQVLIDWKGRLVPSEYSASCGGIGTRNVLDKEQSIRCHPQCQHRRFSGSSHWRGLCQWGSFEFARDGEDFFRLLWRYYPGTNLGSLLKKKNSLLQNLFKGALPL